jgi:hypothetical protein
MEPEWRGGHCLGMGEVIPFRFKPPPRIARVLITSWHDGRPDDVTYVMNDGQCHSKPLGPEDSPHIKAARAARILTTLADTGFLEEGHPQR